VDVARIGPDDWARFRAVRLASLLDAPAAFGSRHEDWLDAPEARWRARLTEVPLTLVAHHGAEDVGVVSGQLAGESWAELISMWVHPAARGTGVAEALITAMVAWAGRQGRSTYLMVRSDNARARAAYERVGFVDRGVPDGWPATEPLEHRMELLR
jgi:ribosomal protein S18 acetylase RimI-like enzyme